MKKYVKPEIYYEEFQMSQSVAACGWDVNSATVETCGAQGDPEFANPEFITMFADSNVCNMFPGQLEQNGNTYQSFFYCYMTGALNDATKAFHS